MEPSGSTCRQATDLPVADIRVLRLDTATTYNSFSHITNTESNQKLSLYMKFPREAVDVQVAQTKFQDILIKHCALVLMTHLVNSKVETKACCFAIFSIMGNLCAKII